LKPVKEIKKYAKIFINVVDIEEIPKALYELSLVEDLISKNREFESLLVNPGFSKKDREEVLKLVAEKLALSEKMLKFIMYLAEIRVVVALSGIIKIASAIYLEKKKRAKALVLTPVELSKSHEERLKAALKQLIEKDVDIEIVLDPSLLGGVLVKVGSTMYDSSIKGQMRLLKEELIKG